MFYKRLSSKDTWNILKIIRCPYIHTIYNKRNDIFMDDMARIYDILKLIKREINNTHNPTIEKSID